jgi:tetratricopeptide (TPR) repeat protein
MENKLIITKTTSFEEIRKLIGELRERKGKEKETLKLIQEAQSFGHDFVINLFFEEALTHQHLYMNDNSNKKALFDMEKAVLKASFYVNKYKITDLNSRLFRFMGRVSDYRGQYKKAINYYKKSIKYAKSDPEPFRMLEIEAFLSFSTIMSGQFAKGLGIAKSTYKKFISSEEGQKLRKTSYDTWAIWMSGITIRTVNALIDKKVNFDFEETKKWIEDTEKYLDKNDKFSYRKGEIKELWTKLKNYKNA